MFPVRVGGEVTRMRITPRSGTPALEVVADAGELHGLLDASAYRKHIGE